MKLQTERKFTTIMKESRRTILKSAAVGIAASVAGRTLSLGSESKTQFDDPTVSKRLGPHGKGLSITLAGYEYNRVRTLADGSVQVKGCASTFEVTGIGPLNNHAFFGPQTRDITEIGLIPYMLAYANDNFRDYILLPIPALRLFRHKSMWVRTDSKIKTPADLRGKKVATVGYSSSGLTHIRGILEEEYGVKSSDIKWVSTQKDSASNLTGGVSSWEKLRPEGISITDAPAGEDESSLLLSGKVDAIFHPAEPKAYQERNPLIRRLFTDPRKVEVEYYKKTGVFPIMHSVSIRRKTMEANPWLSKAVFEAYSQAKKADYEHMKTWGWATDTLPWYGQEFNDTRNLMGENFYSYGFEACKSSYQTAIRYLYDQGLSKRKVSIEEMFDPATLGLKEMI
ncbi:MAG: ABC transporter substrate-binding protein [Verrucomicrobiota bacterium]